MKQIALLLCVFCSVGCQRTAPTEAVERPQGTVIVMPSEGPNDCTFQGYLAALAVVTWDRPGELVLPNGKSMRVAGHTHLKIDPVVWTIDGTGYRRKQGELNESEMDAEVRRYVEICRQTGCDQMPFLRSTERTSYEEGCRWLEGLVEAGLNAAILPPW